MAEIKVTAMGNNFYHVPTWREAETVMNWMWHNQVLYMIKQTGAMGVILEVTENQDWFIVKWLK